MAQIDPEQERQRLTAFYRGQMDGELEKVAGEAYELTDLANAALRAELSRRGLRTELVEIAPIIPRKELPVMPGDPPHAPAESTEIGGGGQLEFREMVTIRQFRDLPEALLAKGSLESSGIECALVDDNMVRMDWFISNLLGGVKLQVRSDDAAVALEVLEQPIPEGFDVAGIGEYQQPHCPGCQSLDVSFQENDPAAYVSMVLSMPIPFHRRAWRCQACKAEWEEDGVDNGRDEPPS